MVPRTIFLILHLVLMDLQCHMAPILGMVMDLLISLDHPVNEECQAHMAYPYKMGHRALDHQLSLVSIDLKWERDNTDNQASTGIRELMEYQISVGHLVP